MHRHKYDGLVSRVSACLGIGVGILGSVAGPRVCRIAPVLSPEVVGLDQESLRC